MVGMLNVVKYIYICNSFIVVKLFINIVIEQNSKQILFFDPLSNVALNSAPALRLAIKTVVD